MKKTRRMSFTLTFIMIVSILGCSFASTSFKDVDGTWSADFVADLFFRKVVDGYPDGLYHPTEDVTRGAISKMLLLSMKSAGSGIQKGAENSPFKDTKNHWSEPYIVPLTEQGIIVPSEYSGGFKPDKPMSRVETIKTIVRAYLYAHPEEKLAADSTLTFTDADKIAKADLPYVQKGVALKIIDGYEDGSFRPDANIQRSTAAAMMSRFIKAVGKISDKLAPPSDTRVDGKVDTNKPAPEIRNVEWVLKPTIKLLNDGEFTNFSKFAPDGMSSFWDNEESKDPTFIDLKGNTHVFKGLRNIGEFVQGVAPAMDAKTEMCGYIDFSGNWVCKPDLDTASNLIAYHYKDNTVRYYGMVDRGSDSELAFSLSDMKIVPWSAIPTDNRDYEKSSNYTIKSPDGFDTLGRPTKGGLFLFSEHMAVGQGMAEGNYYGICDKDGKIILKPTYFQNGIQNLHSSYLSGKAYDDCFILSHRLTVLWDCIDDIYDGTTGKLLFSMYNTDYGSPTRNVKGYGNGLILYFTGSGNDIRFGYMKPDGTETIADIFEEAEPFSNGYAWVKTGGLWGIIKLPTV